ncbi:hypothetical protein AYR62_10450 [Secundilactobacillus paracollinoides]|uniref:Phospholipase/carboxylesterase/thioesterase domain-containing protein n=1 Tax=Secundilactobacillus paracollinoides TaxID=240427 RepID=A0A1B2IYA6_9LACO|nr:alpha/beta hydrolase [Secundilactobacillus paracollinoides]ANZ61145.1 hypothetical protein AYR61_07185 [Secundilactobacillus paracollinoides]ANZ64461.1 hypothetical protein AYR62_10450 [Secundilactobacillus paracollinoides]ANZ67066.1 hypothetical protein AYR63_07930 [Secundilactobacillus paracollinoides]KRL76063.1 phospholipase carboxylesterase family protein [Secundilactobacillus paracollinoides DSM 15502 = JCM 11969]
MNDADQHVAYFPGQSDLAPVLMLHGTGGDEQDLFSLANFLLPQHPTLGIRGRITEGAGANRYFIRHADGSFDLDNISSESDWLWDSVSTLTAEHQLDAQQLIVLGFSNGANIAAYSLLHKQPPFKTAVLLHPMLIEPQSTLPDLTGVNLFATFGDLDPIVTETNFDELITELKTAGADVTVFKNHQSHHPSQAELAAAKDWLSTK